MKKETHIPKVIYISSAETAVTLSSKEEAEKIYQRSIEKEIPHVHFREAVGDILDI